MNFLDEHSPSLEAYWRAIILFGRNSASYKFALAQTLLECSENGAIFVTLEDLAGPFAQHVTRHLALVDKQGTAPNSNFLQACRDFNAGSIDSDELARRTVRLGFVNVIDAFHMVNQGETPLRFFEDVRSSRKGIVLTDSLLVLRESGQNLDLTHEVEARWRLVETAWSLDMANRSLEVRFDRDGEIFFTETRNRRYNITSCRDALNGYQKGKCFYCFADVSLQPGDANLADVDHFFPWTLNQYADGRSLNLDGVWNLVLSCSQCNRGSAGKFARIPKQRLQVRLHRRNSFLIESHHPLRETLIRQTGATEDARTRFLKDADRVAINHLIHRWEAPHEVATAF